MEQQRPAPFSQDYQKEWSSTHKYKHIHTGEYCTFEAYVAEYIVLRRAEKLNIGKPAYKFWTKGDPNYWLWRKQLGAARQLKKKYSEEAILAAITSKDFDKLLVIGVQDGRGYKVNPLAEKVISKYDNEIKKTYQNKSPKVNENIVKENIITRQTQSYSKNKTSINKLRNL